MIATLAFYLFSIILLLSAGMVVTARNPVHSVLFLILAFFNAAALFVLAGAEFLAMALVIVYVGAVAVLFLFVVMMLDINFAALREGFQRYLPIGAVVGTVLLVELALVLGGHGLVPVLAAPAGAAAVPNTQALGAQLYTQYILAFQVSGLILLVAMIGAIVLTHRDRRAVLRQRIARQLDRNPGNTLHMVDARIGAAVTKEEYLRPLAEVAPADAAAAPHDAPGGHH